MSHTTKQFPQEYFAEFKEHNPADELFTECPACKKLVRIDSECECKVFGEQSALSVQVGGNHYKDMAIQPIEFTMKNNLNFCQGNIIKYVTRYKHKNGIEDLKKAKHYIDLLIDLEYKEGSK